MTLWVFGDSYANGYDSKPWFWSVALADKLSTDIQNYGVAGTGLEFTYGELQKCYKEFKKSDVIVICLTQFHRQYFIPDYPQISIPVSLDNPFITPTELKHKYKQAFNLFADKLYNESNSKVNLKNFLFFLQYLSEKIELQIVVLPCFNDVNTYLQELKYEISFHIGSGNLFSISESECADQKTIEVFYDYEARANHICRRNHEVLSNKIFECLTNNTKIDLTAGFHSNFMTKELSTNKEFAEYEYLYPDKIVEVQKYNLFSRFTKRASFP